MNRQLLCSAPLRRGGVIFAVAIGAMASSAHVRADQAVTVNLPQPSLDRWNYPFNQSMGTRWTAPVFSSYLETDFFEGFDQRDGQLHIGFETQEHVEPGLGPAAYEVTGAQVTVMTATNNSFHYSLTLPKWQWYRPPDDPEFLCPIEADPCPPGNAVIPPPALKLFGTGFRNGFDALSIQETTAYSPFGPFGQGHRTVHPIDFDGAGNARDVSNNVEDGFDPNPFALGVTNAIALGQPVPVDTTFTFEIDVNDPHIQQYLREGLDLGVLHFVIATLHITEQQTGGSAPEFYCKENPLVDFGLANAAGLSITVKLTDPGIVGDLDGNGVVNVFDLLMLLGNWGNCIEGEPCPADLDGNGSVNVFDLLMLLGNWG